MKMRNTYGEVEVGDGIKTYVDRKAPSNAYANGRLWSGEVTKVERHGERVAITVDVHGRSLCADDLVYGFGNARDGSHKPVVMTLNRKADEYVQQRVRDVRTGRRYWAGVEVYAGPEARA